MADVVRVVRHGERGDSVDPDWAETAERPHDPPLTELGRWAAWRVGRRFVERAVEIDVIYASPFLRTVETAAEIADEIGGPVRLEPGLGEHRNADWFEADPETLSDEELAATFEPVTLDHEPLVAPDFPEKHADAAARVGETACRLVERTPGSILLVGHGLTIGGVVGGLAGSTEGVEAPLCGVTRLDRTGPADDPDWRLAFSGDTQHL